MAALTAIAVGRTRRVLTGLALAVAFLTGGGTLAAAFARTHWLAELFSHYPVHYLLGAAAAAGVLLGAGRWRLALLPLLVVGINASIVGPYLPGFVVRRPPLPADAATVSLIAWNLDYRNTRFDQARDYLRAMDADVLVLTEYTPRWQQALAPLGYDYLYRVARPQFNAWGIAVYSRYPLLQVEDLILADPESANLRVVIDLPDGPLELFAVHLASPTAPARAALRNRQLRELGQLAGDRPPVMARAIVGDLNTSPFSPWFRDLLAAARLTDARRPFGLHYTWPALPLPLWVAIDHFLSDGRLEIGQVRAGPYLGSDHRPLEVRFAIRQ